VRGDAISFSKETYPRKFHGSKIIPNAKTEIKSIIHSLKATKSSGYDQITSTILKVCASLISHPLTHICNHSLFSGIFPDHLKISVVRPLYKKGGKISMSNYRSISLLTTFSKVLEKVMHDRLSHYLQTNNTLVLEQFGFRKGLSAENAAIMLTDGVFKSVNQKCLLMEYSVIWQKFLTV
jgi:Notch-like protein